MRHPPVIPAQSSCDVRPTMDLNRCIGECVLLFFIAVALDVVGLILLFVGIFADPRIDDRFYGDFLIYTGSLIVFFSLGCWLMWYVGNVQVHEEDYDGPRKRSSIAKLARKLSERLSQKLKGEERQKRVGGGGGGGDEDSGQVGSPPHKASRVTWGKSTAYHNEGYDDSLDSSTVKNEKEEKLDI